VAALAGLAPAGCAGWWDEVTSRDFKVKSLFEGHPDPLVVLRDSSDGNQRAKALRALREPRQVGGDEHTQDVVVQVLTTAAYSERQPLCRLAAISSLRNFKDPRVAEGLQKAYDRAGNFPPETATVIRCQALEAMGDVASPESIATLARVLRQPPPYDLDAEVSKQQVVDERIAAARALGKYKSREAAEALAGVLKSDKDVALRDVAYASLKESTGKDLPADAQAWAEYLQGSPNQGALAGEPKKFLGILPVRW
jgi:HEAT repeat protein